MTLRRQHQILWITTFLFFLLATGSCDPHRVIVCNPIIILTCEP